MQMYRCLLFLSFFLFHLNGFTQSSYNYQSLDITQPIKFSGRSITFSGDTILLGPRAFFIDGNLPDSIVRQYPYVFNSVKTAAAHLTNGNEETPMMVYLAPWVYWIDNPDDSLVRVPKPGVNTPYGMEISCEWLHFKGLNSHPENIVLAANRGQTIGAKGNFTMFKFSGNGISSENLSFGNYCNVDLSFPLRPALGRAKRAAAIVQAQLIHCNADKVLARNTRFISRLNLCPFAGAKRILFDHCHFECTDDALCSTGVYLNSSFDFYSSKPFYNTNGTGAVLLNCDVHSLGGKQQYFTKAGGQLAVVNSRFAGDANTYWGWQDVVSKQTRNYQVNNTINKAKLMIGSHDTASTIHMEGKEILDAYLFIHDGAVVYNTYNLLRGDDDWDPMGIRHLVMAAEKANHTSYSGIAIQLTVTPNRAVLETNKNTAVLEARLFRFGNYIAKPETIFWKVDTMNQAIVKLEVSADGQRCRVIPTNQTDNGRFVVVTAFTASGLEGASVLQVLSPILDAPGFISKPSLRLLKDGSINLAYTLNNKYADESEIRWFRCQDSNGRNGIEVAVTRNGQPLKNYTLSAGDIGYWLGATVAPKNQRSRPGQVQQVVLHDPIAAKNIKTNLCRINIDFEQQSLRNQPLALPGFFTFSNASLSEPDPGYNTDTTKDAWYFGEGADGAAGMTGLLQGRHARMLYTPRGASFGDMDLNLTVAPFKTAGQGFSVAGLYMDVLIKFDAGTLSGYALRFIRTTKYGNAVDCMLMKYTNGKALAVTSPITTNAYRTPCFIKLSTVGSMLRATVHTNSPEAATNGAVQKEVLLETSIIPGNYGGFGIEYHGGSPTMINKMIANWAPR
jgi:hypothetical protein